MKFFVAAAVATVAFAQDDQAAWNKKARENLPEPIRKMLQKDCDFISEEDFKKMSDPVAAEAAEAAVDRRPPPGAQPHSNRIFIPAIAWQSNPAAIARQSRSHHMAIPQPSHVNRMSIP